MYFAFILLREKRAKLREELTYVTLLGIISGYKMYSINWFTISALEPYTINAVANAGPENRDQS